MTLARIHQLVQVWISNVMRIYSWDRKTAMHMCMKINPYGKEINQLAKELFNESK